MLKSKKDKGDSTFSGRKVDYKKTGGTLLYKAIEQRQWKSVMARIQSHPHEVTTFVFKLDATKTKKYEFKVLPLHAALMRQPPKSVVSALIGGSPKASNSKCDGDNALHVALKHGASIDVLECLILANPKSIKETNADGKTALQGFVANSMSYKDMNEKNLIEKLLKKGVAGVQLSPLKQMTAKLADMSMPAVTPAATPAPATMSKSADMSMPAAMSMPAMSMDPTADEDDLKTTLDQEGWKQAGLVIVVIGASGDLAKKKTYPSILRLFADNLLPADTKIYGYARSAITDEQLREKLRPYLEKAGDYSQEAIDGFLAACHYQQGKSYGDVDAYKQLAMTLEGIEVANMHKLNHNRLFYFAIPPSVFEETGVAIKETSMATKGWTRIIIEKPFGKDLQSCEDLLAILSKHFEEDQMFRIDHYLGKEMVQNLLTLRFSNLWFEKIWNRDSIQCVLLTFKEPFGTDGRGGYFDQYGIIRDIVQNHLLQVLSLLAMEAPSNVDGPDAGEAIRDAKVQALKAIPPITMDEVFLGQYEGYTDDPTIKNKDSNCPTYVAIRCFVNTPRWEGVPFIFKAGKALNERKAEMRIQFKEAPGSSFLFENKCPRNELVMRMQPNEAVYIKTNVKSPGFSSDPIQSELEINYNDRFFQDKASGNNPDAYTRLILDVLRGRSATFVREDELRRAWEIFTPILHRIENENIRPVVYKCQSRGPPEADEWIAAKSGYVRNQDYVFLDGGIARKSTIG